MRLLFGTGVPPALVLILIRAILEHSINNKTVSKIQKKLECLLLISIYTNANFSSHL